MTAVRDLMVGALLLAEGGMMTAVGNLLLDGGGMIAVGDLVMAASLSFLR